MNKLLVFHFDDSRKLEKGQDRVESTRSKYYDPEPYFAYWRDDEMKDKPEIYQATVFYARMNLRQLLKRQEQWFNSETSGWMVSHSEIQDWLKNQIRIV